MLFAQRFFHDLQIRHAETIIPRSDPAVPNTASSIGTCNP